MYSSGYSEVSKDSPVARKKMQYRSKGKSCGYYMRIVFFFSSLIQSLIIVSLVLFLIYGKKQDSASTSRIQDLEDSFSRLSIENVALRQQRKNLTNLLNTTLTNKARNDWDLAELRHFANISAILIKDIDRRLQQCTGEFMMCKTTPRLPSHCQTPSTHSDRCNCGLLVEQLKARLEFVESNFTQTTQRMRMEMDQITKERDNVNLEAIRLRRDKSTHEKEVEFYRQKCKDDFSQSLSGVSNVTKAFLQKVDSLFPAHIAFQLTCAKQREHLEQIRTNCTSLSREVEDRFQRYLNSVGEQVSSIQGENSRLKAENWRLSEDYRWCSQNRTGLIQQHRQNLDKLQQKHDEDKERLLMDKMRLNGEIEVLINSVKYKSKEVEHLTEKIKYLNMSCISKPGFGGFSGGSNSWTGTQSQPGFSGSAFNKPGSTGAGSSSSSLFSTGLGSSTGSAFNKPGSTGAGSSSSSLFSTGLGSSTGSAFNKPGSTGAGSSSSSLFSTGLGSSTGSAFNKPGSTGAGSSSSSSSRLGRVAPPVSILHRSAFNKPGSTGAGSSSSSLFSTGSGSPAGSAFNKPGSTGAGSSSSSLFSTGSGSSTGSAFNKPGSTGAGSSSSSLFSTGSGSSGSAFNKPAFPSFGSTGSNPNLGSSGIGANKPALNGKGSSASGSSSGPTGSTNKSGSSSSPFSWFNSGLSKTGSGTGKGTSSGTSNGGTGSSFGAGKTSGFGGGPVSVTQHLQDLQRIINPPGPEEKQDLARMLG
ncbi:plasmalemma vesicle associated protein a [Siniperca chuatsi]|uniref:plasmalemma vesicle associated protein a n=1 Tax=Siniperca chuatsi TaxID=119488 RepID=UPI001CE13F8D|nr:plasmalemma vesicle associated protein a [Siniperca chuatsi]